VASPLGTFLPGHHLATLGRKENHEGDKTPLSLFPDFWTPHSLRTNVDVPHQWEKESGSLFRADLVFLFLFFGHFLFVGYRVGETGVVKCPILCSWMNFQIFIVLI